MYVMEFAIPRCGWNRTQILKKWPHSEIKLSFSSPLLFPPPQKCFMEGNTPIILPVKYEYNAYVTIWMLSRTEEFGFQNRAWKLCCQCSYLIAANTRFP